MNQYVTGTVIKELREKNNMTQAELAKMLCVSDKTVSKWETGKGYPDISLLEPYPEGSPSGRFKIRGVKRLYFYCNKDGLFFLDINKYVDGRERSHEDTKERRELEEMAGRLFK